MSKLKFHIVDVFCESKYEGNQLAVVRGGSQLPDDRLQKIAREMNFSETTFILDEKPGADGGYPVRIFTPGAEIPFAGHPALGTAYVIREEILRQPLDTVTLSLKAGQIPVRFPANSSDVLWMTQLPPIFSEVHDPETVANILHIEADDIDSRYPIQTVSTGTPFVLVPLKTLAAVRRASLNREAYYAYAKQHVAARAILFFSPETYAPANQLNARMFAEIFGVPEDPATGSANGCLAGWLVKYRYFNTPKIDINVEQGYEMMRPSLLRLRAEERPAGIHIEVGGKVIPVAEGVLL